MITTLKAIVPVAEWIFNSSLKASVLVALILIIQFLLRRKIAARWLYAAWLLLIIRLMMPFDIQSPVSLFNLAPAKKIPSLQIDISPADFATPPVRTANFDVPPIPDQVPPVAEPGGQNYHLSAKEILVLVWLLGVIGLLIYTFINNFKLWRRVRLLPPLSNSRLFHLLDRCKKQMKIGRPIALIEMEGMRIPALFGIIKPKILLPVNLTDQMSADQIEHIFLHELAHYKRHDVLISFLAALLQIINWFNPIIWFAFYRMRIDRELACDEMTLNRIGADQSRSYGQTIISLLEGIAAEFRSPVTVGIIETKKDLKRRLAMIANFKKRPIIWSIVAIGILIAAAGFALTDAQINSPKTASADLKLSESSGDESNSQDSPRLPSQDIRQHVSKEANTNAGMADSLKDAVREVSNKLSRELPQNNQNSKPYRSEIVISFTSEGLKVAGKIVAADSLAHFLRKFSFDDRSVITLKPQQDGIINNWFKVQTALRSVPVQKIKYVNAKNGRVVITKNYPFEIFNAYRFGLRPKNLGGKYGYVDRQGKIAIQAKFDMAWPFEENLAGAKLGGKWGFIDTTGNFVIDPQFDQITAFKDGIAVVKTHDKWGFIDPLGKPLLKAKFTLAYNFSEGYAPVQNNQKWAYVSKTDRDIALSYKYDRAYGFQEGLAAVKIGKKWGFIDYAGNTIIDFKFDDVDRFSDGLALVRINGKYGYIDKTGNFVIKPQFDHAESFSEGMAVVRVNGKYGYIDKTGQIVIDPRYDHASRFTAGSAIVTIFENPEQGIKGRGLTIDKAGNMIGEIPK